MGCCKHATGWLRITLQVDAASCVLTVPCVVVTGRVLKTVGGCTLAWTAGCVLELSTLWVYVTAVPFEVFLFSVREFGTLLVLLSDIELELEAGITVTFVLTLSVKCGFISETVFLLVILFSTSLSFAFEEKTCF